MKINANNSAGLTDRIQLLIGQIASGRTKGMCSGMGYDQRCIGYRGCVPESLFIDMGQINQNTQEVASFDQLPTGVAQTGARVG